MLDFDHLGGEAGGVVVVVIQACGLEAPELMDREEYGPSSNFKMPLPLGNCRR